MINKIKEILSTLTNNIEKYGVSLYKGKRYNDNNTFIDYYQVTFRQFDKWYFLEFINNSVKIRINTRDNGDVGGNIDIPISSDEILSINILLNTLVLKGNEFVKESIKNLEL